MIQRGREHWPQGAGDDLHRAQLGLEVEVRLREVPRHPPPRGRLLTRPGREPPPPR